MECPSKRPNGPVGRLRWATAHDAFRGVLDSPCSLARFRGHHVGVGDAAPCGVGAIVRWGLAVTRERAALAVECQPPGRY